MNRTVVLAAAFVCFLTSGQLVEAAAGSPNLIQAFVGFNQPNALGLPCAGCLGYPASTVWVQPNQFVSSGSSGLYYTVLQENGWSGNVSASFQLTGAGSVIQSATLTGTITAGQGLGVLSGSATIPATTYSGPATLTVNTTASPGDGSPPFTLTSEAAMQVGTTGIRKLVQAFGGLSTGTLVGCTCANCGPPSAVCVQPDQFPVPGHGGAEYVVFQADGWLGSALTTIDAIAAGKIIQTVQVGGVVDLSGSGGHLVILFGVDAWPTGTGYAGPAIMRLTTEATSEYGDGQPFTMRSLSPLYIE